MQYVYFAGTHQNTRNTAAVPITRIATRAVANQVTNTGVY